MLQVVLAKCLGARAENLGPAALVCIVEFGVDILIQLNVFRACFVTMGVRAFFGFVPWTKRLRFVASLPLYLVRFEGTTVPNLQGPQHRLLDGTIEALVGTPTHPYGPLCGMLVKTECWDI